MRDFPDIAVLACCWRGICLQLPRRAYCIAAQITEAAVRQLGFGWDRNCSFAAAWSDSSDTGQTGPVHMQVLQTQHRFAGAGHSPLAAPKIQTRDTAVFCPCRYCWCTRCSFMQQLLSIADASFWWRSEFHQNGYSTAPFPTGFDPSIRCADSSIATRDKGAHPRHALG